MTEQKKRISVPHSVYMRSVEIGQEAGAIGKSSVLATAGVEAALGRFNDTEGVDPAVYEKLLKYSNISESIANNIEAIKVLSKNTNLTDNEIDIKINAALRAVIAEIMELK